MSPAIVYIPSADVSKVWPLMAPMVEALVARNPREFTTESVQIDAKAGKIQLWLIWQPDEKRALAIAATKIEIGFDNTLIAKPVFLTGSGLLRWRWALLDKLIDWARESGCKVFEGPFRKGYSRYLARRGFRQTHVVMELAL